jgi:hypothetical protein
VVALRMTLGEEGYMGEGSAQRIAINGVSDMHLMGSRSIVGLTWSGKELLSSGRGDFTVVDSSLISVMTMVGLERMCERGNVL